MPEDLPEDQGGEQPTGKRSRIRAAAEKHDVDLDHAIVGSDGDPESDRIYMIEDIRTDGYRLIAFGMDGDGNAASEQPIHIPDSAVGAIQGLLHAAGMHVVEHLERDAPVYLRDLAEGMGLSEPLKPQADEPRARFEDDTDSDPDDH